MLMRVVLVAVGMMLATAAVADDAALIKQAEDAVTHNLLDPESARFRDVGVNGDTVCGQVNAKNAYGGYIGFRSFYVLSDGTDSGIEPASGDSDWLAYGLRFAYFCGMTAKERESMTTKQRAAYGITE